MAETEVVESCRKDQTLRRVCCLKINTVDDLKEETVNKVVKELAPDVRGVDTNHSTSYVELKNFAPRHN